MHRRKFLTFSLLTASSFTYATTIYKSLPYLNDIHVNVNNYLVSVYSDFENATILGHKYLSAYPEKLTLTQLFSDMGFYQKRCEGMSRSMFINTLIAQHEIDFVQGNMVTVDNWIVTRTEASACAFLTLYQRSC